jgi:hypothetical protein
LVTQKIIFQGGTGSYVYKLTICRWWLGSCVSQQLETACQVRLTTTLVPMHSPISTTTITL